MKPLPKHNIVFCVLRNGPVNSNGAYESGDRLTLNFAHMDAMLSCARRSIATV
jgi:hypothetical protein